MTEVFDLYIFFLKICYFYNCKKNAEKMSADEEYKTDEKIIHVHVDKELIKGKLKSQIENRLAV